MSPAQSNNACIFNISMRYTYELVEHVSGEFYFNATTPNLSKRYILGKESVEKTIGEEINSRKEKLSEIRAFEYVNVITVCKWRASSHNVCGILASARGADSKRLL